MDQSSPTTSRTRRWLRRCLYSALVLLGIVGAGLWVITRSWFITAQIEPELAVRLGGEVSIASASYEGDGRFMLRDVVLRAPHHPGAAGEVLRVAQARLRVDEGRLFRGEIQLHEIELDGVLLRLAENAEEVGQFTFMDLAPQWDEDAADVEGPLPRLSISHAVVEYGMFSASEEYAARGRRSLQGLMEPHPNEDHTYRLELAEVDEAGLARSDGISIGGVWNVETNAHDATIRGLALDEPARNMMPQSVRWWWDNLGLEGQLTDARVSWDDGKPLSVVFNIENVGITLPLDQTHQWARYHAGTVTEHQARPRLRVHSGQIRFEDNAIIIDEPLIGELRSEDMLSDGPDAVSVPWAVTVHIQDLRPLDWAQRDEWMRETLDEVPFTMELAVENLRIAPDQTGQLPPVDLPLQVAMSLQRFQLTEFTLTMKVTVQRGGTGQITSHGEVLVSDASGAYEEFPYPLRGIDASISFQGDFVTIDSLEGLAPSGATVKMSGTVDTLGRAAKVDLRLRTDRVPLDEHLRHAMRIRNLVFLDAVVNERAHAALVASGKLAGNEHDSADFELGGEVALDLSINRAAGLGQPTDVKGRIDIHSLGVVYEHFPYPFTAVGGSLLLEADGVQVIEDETGRGVPVVTAGGGNGFVRGSVRTKRIDGQLSILPDLHIEVAGDQMNPLITAAIPPGREGAEADDADETLPQWPGGELTRPVALLESAGISGSLDYSGRVFTEEGELRYEFMVDVLGRAAPREELAGMLGESGLIWPPDMVLEDVSARVRIVDGEVTLLKFDGDHGQGRLAATGLINWEEEATRTNFDIDLIDLMLGRYLVDLMPSENIETVKRLWDRYQPSGTFDARLEIRVVGEDVEPPRLSIDPTGAVVMLEGEQMELGRDDGRLVLHDGRAIFDDFVLTFDRRGEDGEQPVSDGSVRLSGSYGLGGGGGASRDLTIDAEWIGGRFDSPIVLEAMRRFGAQDSIDDFKQLNARGLFNAEFSLDWPSPEQPREYHLTVQPRTLLFDLRGTPLEAELREDSKVSFEGDAIELHRLSGVIGGEAFFLRGTIETGEQPRIALDEISFDGRLMNPQIQAILPAEVRDVLKQIQFEDGPRTTIDGAKLTLLQRDSEKGLWDASFAGSLRMLGASFNAGVEVTDFRGGMDIVFETLDSEDGRAAPRLEVDVFADRLQLAERQLTNLRAPGIALDDEGDSIHMPNIRAECYGGLVWLEAVIGLTDGAPYEARLEVVGASVRGLITGEAEDTSSGRSRRKGTVNAGLRLEGRMGDPSSRNGRGVIRAVGGSIEHVPLVLQLMQILQLSLPTGAVDNAHAEVVILGDRAVFERILLESTLGNLANLQLFGEGEVNLATLELHTQFRSRTGTLLIRDLVGGIGDQLYVIEVTGTLRNPKARIVPLPAFMSQRSHRSLRRDTAAVVEDEDR